MVDGKYACQRCGGDGEVTCRECGGDCTCRECAGTGINPSIVDAKRYDKAVREMRDRIFADPKRTIGDIDIFDNGNTVGRDGQEHGRVMIADFLVN